MVPQRRPRRRRQIIVDGDRLRGHDARLFVWSAARPLHDEVDELRRRRSVENVCREIADRQSVERAELERSMRASRDELRHFLDNASDDRLHACWVVAATTGLRRGELLGLRWEDVDLDGQVFSVKRSLLKSGVRVTGSTGTFSSTLPNRIASQICGSPLAERRMVFA